MSKVSLSEFRDQFDLPFDGFLAPTDFIDGGFGFGVLKNRPNNYVSMFKVSIDQKKLEESEPIKPITITASYGRKTEDGVLLSSSNEKIKGILDPIDLISLDEFFYNTATREFFFKEPKQKYGAADILRYINELHEKPTKPVQGFALRVKLIFWHIVIAGLVKIFSNALAWLLYVSSGTTVSMNIWNRIVFPDRIAENADVERKFKEAERKEILGYKASPWVIVFFCSVHLVLYFLFLILGFRPGFLVAMFKNNFLTIIYVVISLSFVEVLLPKILKSIIKKADLLYRELSGRKIRI